MMEGNKVADGDWSPHDMTMRGIEVEEAQAAGFDGDRLRNVFRMVQHWIDQGVLPGAAALVTRGGKIAGEAYLGSAVRDGRPVTSNTLWALASITKPFTATTVLLSVEQGYFSLDEPIYQLLPEFLDAPTSAFDRRSVTVRHMLAHCSGLPGFTRDNLLLRQAHRPLEDFVPSFMREPLLFAAGSLHLYSNIGVLLAAEVVSRAICGTLRQEVSRPAVANFHTIVEREILTPLGMKNSSLRPSPEWYDRIAWVEETGQEGLDWETANSSYYRALGIPWGGLFSSPRELRRLRGPLLAGGKWSSSSWGSWFPVPAAFRCNNARHDSHPMCAARRAGRSRARPSRLPSDDKALVAGCLGPWLGDQGHQTSIFRRLEFEQYLWA